MKYLVANIHMAHRVADIVRDLNCEGSQWDVEIKPHKKQRTHRQNSLMWKWYTIIGNELGYEKDEIHDVLREKFLPVQYVEIMGIQKKILTSTSSPDFTTAMEAEYLEKMDRFAAQDLGILLPHPEDDAYTQWAERART